MDIKTTLRSARVPLQYFRLWQVIGWFLVALIIWGSLTPAPPHLHIADGDKVQHFSAYGIVMMWFAQLYRRPVHWLLALACVALGVAMEYAQLASGYRDFEYMDMVADAVGTALGWVLAGTSLMEMLPAVDRRLGAVRQP